MLCFARVPKTQEGSTDNKKPQNVSLYILGEYDILNDLVNDGAKRLRDNREKTDLDLLRQNDPCPPPNRWVRPTGWGRCNPSSMYAKDPPPDFDWVRYYDKLRLRTSEYKKARQQQQHRDDGGASGGSGAGRITDTQTTEATASASDDLSTSDEHHRSEGGRLVRVTRARSSSSSGSPKVISGVKTSPTECTTPGGGGAHQQQPSSGGGGGARSHFQQQTQRAAAADTLSKSARASSRASSHFATRAVGDCLSASKRKPPRGGGFGRRVSSVLGRKKSSASGAE